MSIGIENRHDVTAPGMHCSEAAAIEDEVKRITVDRCLYGSFDIKPLRLERMKENRAQYERDHQAACADPEQKAAPLSVDQKNGNHRHQALEEFDAEVALGCVRRAHAGLPQDHYQKSQNGVDPRCLGTSQNDAGQHKRNNIFSSQQGVFDMGCGPGVALAGDRLHLDELQFSFIRR